MNEPWTPPTGREARNEQRKLRAGVANGLAAAVAAVAILGDLINPAVADQLSDAIRLGMALLAWLLHLLATWFVRDIEDK